MIEIKNKFDINDLVFVFADGKIIHCRVNRICVDVSNDGNEVSYYINALDDAYNDYLDIMYKEEELCSRIEDILNILEVH